LKEIINKGIPGLLDFISMGKPKMKNTIKRDKGKYLEILNETGALYELDKNGKPKIKGSSSKKYRNIIKPIRDEKSFRLEELETLGQGIILPSEPNALCEQLELLMALKQAGNTGVINEIVNICAEHLRQKILPCDAYKNLKD